MIETAHVPAPGPAELRACSLAALAEAGLVFLPAHLLLTESRAVDVGAALLVAPFVVAYVVGALLACRFRSSRVLAPVAAAVAGVGGLGLADGGITRTAFAVLVLLAVALRVVGLGLRDWRTPIHAELGWWAAILGTEALLAAGAVPGWRPVLAVLIPLVFVAALASRATAVWAESGTNEAGVRGALGATGALAAAMAITVALAVRGGLLDLVGRWLGPVIRVVEALFFWLVVQAARPLFWLVDRLGFDPGRAQRALERLREGTTRPRPIDLPPTAPSAWQRVIGLVLFLAIGYVVYRVLRRFRPRVEDEATPRDPVAPVASRPTTEPLDPPPRWRFRQELPADAVRRLYAEVVLDLRDRRVVKPPSLTPAEFVPEVARVVPDGADDFAMLTRAYQDVRYGLRRLDRADVRELELRQRRFLAMVRHGGGGHVTPNG